MINFTETVRLTKTKNSREWRFQRPPLDKKRVFKCHAGWIQKNIDRSEGTPSIPVF